MLGPGHWLLRPSGPKEDRTDLRGESLGLVEQSRDGHNGDIRNAQTKAPRSLDRRVGGWISVVVGSSLVRHYQQCLFPSCSPAAYWPCAAGTGRGRRRGNSAVPRHRASAGAGAARRTGTPPGGRGIAGALRVAPTAAWTGGVARVGFGDAEDPPGCGCRQSQQSGPLADRFPSTCGGRAHGQANPDSAPLVPAASRGGKEWGHSRSEGRVRLRVPAGRADRFAVDPAGCG